jgi:hypothetical protein
MERDLAGVGFAECGKHLDTPGGGCRHDFSDQTAFADPRGSYHGDHRAVTVDNTFQQTLDGGHLPTSTYQSRLSTRDGTIPVGQAQQLPGGHGFISALDVDQLRFPERHHALDHPSGGGTEHHPTRGSDRLHPLSHPHLLTDSGITERPRTDLTGDHLAGVHADAQLEVDTVALLDFDGEPLCLVLNAQGRAQFPVFRLGPRD